MERLWTPGLPRVWTPPPPPPKRRWGPEWGDQPYDWPGLRREPLRAAWGFVQNGNAAQGSGASLGVTLGSNITSGNRLIAVAYVYGSGITLTKVSDNLGNQGATAGQYDQILSQSDTFNGHLYVLTAPITTGGSCTITATASGTASFISIWVGEYSGLSTATGSSAWDVTASNGANNGSTSPTTGTTANVSSAGELAVAAYGNTADGTITITGPGGGWTQRLNATPSATILPLVIDDETPTSGAGASSTWTSSATDVNNGYAAAIVVFKLAGAVATAPQVTYAYGSN